MVADSIDDILAEIGVGMIGENPVRVILCDDVPDISEPLAGRLRMQFPLMEVANYGEPVAAMADVSRTRQKKQPCIAVFDEKLPNLSGDECVHQLGSEAQTRLIIFTGTTGRSAPPGATIVYKPSSDAVVNEIHLQMANIVSEKTGMPVPEALLERREKDMAAAAESAREDNKLLADSRTKLFMDRELNSGNLSPDWQGDDYFHRTSEMRMLRLRHVIYRTADEIKDKLDKAAEKNDVATLQRISGAVFICDIAEAMRAVDTGSIFPFFTDKVRDAKETLKDALYQMEKDGELKKGRNNQPIPNDWLSRYAKEKIRTVIKELDNCNFELSNQGFSRE